MPIALLVIFSLIFNASAFAAKPSPTIYIKPALKKKIDYGLDSPIVFDIPIDYNKEVKSWIKHFQTEGRGVFTTWLKRSHRYLPRIQKILAEQGLPQDLAYIAMIESGFSSNATSAARAVGPWQFIPETAERFGLQVNWWLDERRNLEKSTRAAAKYFKYLNSLFGSWYLSAAAYNTGENRIIRLIGRHQTKSFWAISKKGGFHIETKDYIPKLIATMLIAKAPNLYGFRNITPMKPETAEPFRVPGGTHLNIIADTLKLDRNDLRNLNPELLKGYVPSSVSGHYIRIPKGLSTTLSSVIHRQILSENESDEKLVDIN
jgi:membrane-bound lytic murein transglycosylase D